MPPTAQSDFTNNTVRAAAPSPSVLRTSRWSASRPNPAQRERFTAGGLIDRGQPLPFRFDGRDLTGLQGDTLASALLANGVRLVGRSFKYHRPRGILTAGSEEPNALVELRDGARREPNTPATMIELFYGLQAQSQNHFPSLRFDLLAVNGVVAPLIKAGFYYKTFMWPAAFWERVYEPLIRRAAGLGRASGLPDPDTYERATLFCDVLVIGAGPAGLAAALAAGRRGARVVLCDEDFQPGGRLLAEDATVESQPGAAWAASAIAELATLPEVRILPRTTVFGAYDHGTYGALERVADHRAQPASPHQPRQRCWHIIARRAVLAAGATERPLVFPGNDRPGVMLAGAVRAYLNRFAVAPGRDIVLATSGDEGWRTLADCLRHGLRVAAVVDRRADVAASLQALAARAGARVFAGGCVASVRGARGVRSVTVIDAAGTAHRVSADLLAMAGGWNPALALSTHLGGKPIWQASAAAFIPGDLPPRMLVAGAAGGKFGLAAALADGAQAGSAAAASCGFDGPPPPPLRAEPGEEAASALWLPQPGGKGFVDFQHDVTADDVALAHREGFRSVEHLKRYTTLGMAGDQGRTANVNGLALMAALTGQSIEQTGTTRLRPPYTPVAIGALAGHDRGRDFRPTRLTPAHDWAVAQGAVFTEAGAWLRASHFPESGDADWLAAASCEALAVRQSVGVCDVSTLGKIEMAGPDCGSFLDRLYINTMSTLPVARARYGVMLREDGLVLDDGTVARLAQDRFVISTTTGNAAAVLSHMEFCHQVLWPELDLHFVSVTDRWAQFALAGPRARDVLAAVLDPGCDVSNAAFPFMAACTASVLHGVEARLFRISFSGELAYEIAVPAEHGDAVVRALIAAGETFGIRPYGTEAMAILRVEKGHPAGGELNGQTTARDLGLEHMMSRRKDYIGRVLAQRPALLAPDRLSLVGLRPADRTSRLRAGAHFIPLGAAATIAHDQGWVSSAAFSPTLGHWIGLGFLAGGMARAGDRVRAADPLRGEDVEVQVVAPCQVDPDGARLRV
ncbi:MAG TPA: sarcosine oxidase subunit alpha family protein [Acetobacteraceae bacterium]|nr:sarcosine oxidase subunit alpha family protein [Acetobacteraceae bacterium]